MKVSPYRKIIVGDLSARKFIKYFYKGMVRHNSNDVKGKKKLASEVYVEQALLINQQVAEEAIFI
jgi:hypothetical protein